MIMMSLMKWRMYVCITYVSRCGAIKYNFRTQTHNVGPSTHLNLLVAMVVQQPRTHQSECKVRVAWKWGPYTPTWRVPIGCDPSPPNPGCHVAMGHMQLNIDFSRTITWLVYSSPILGPLPHHDAV